MKRFFRWSFVLCILVFSITACKVKTEPPTKVVVSAKDVNFELKLYVGKYGYREEEAIDCYATLEYIGEEDSITIYHGQPLVGFGLKDERYFDGGYTVLDELITTTLKKGEVVRFDYEKSGGWSADDPNAKFYEDFYTEEALKLPSGEYELSTAIDCSFNESNMIASRYSNSAAVMITVTK
jgi:hypothetical protein